MVGPRGVTTPIGRPCATATSTARSPSPPGGSGWSPPGAHRSPAKRVERRTGWALAGSEYRYGKEWAGMPIALSRFRGW